MILTPAAFVCAQLALNSETEITQEVNATEDGIVLMVCSCPGDWVGLWMSRLDFLAVS